MIKDILLAEDERGCGLLLKRFLEKNDYRVCLVKNGLEALRIVEHLSIDLVITDVVMPEMDGVELYSELKKNPRTEHLPIIITTDKQVFIDSFSALGVDHFVPKSSCLDDLLSKIRNVDDLSKEKRNYLKVFLGCGQIHILDEIEMMLREKGFLVSRMEKLSEVYSKVLVMLPHLILLDVSFYAGITTREMIRSLRCYDVLRPSKIWLYNYVTPDDMTGGMDALYSLETNVNACLEAGAQEYIGQYNKILFLEHVRDFELQYFKPLVGASK